MADAGKIEHSGWLTKRSQWLKEWRRRYFTLRGNMLYFAKSETAHPHGSIDLSECLTVKSADEKTDKKNSFEVATPDSTFYMYADDEKVKDEWIGAIGRAIVRNSNAYTQGASDDGTDSDDETDEDL